MISLNLKYYTLAFSYTFSLLKKLCHASCFHHFSNALDSVFELALYSYSVHDFIVDITLSFNIFFLRSKMTLRLTKMTLFLVFGHAKRLTLGSIIPALFHARHYRLVNVFRQDTFLQEAILRFRVSFV